jgi:AraC-like DNA-binding protein
MRALVRSATLNGYAELARSLGLDAAGLMRRVGLDPADLGVPDKWLPAAAVARLLDASAVESGHADVGVRLAELRRLSTLGPLSVVLREEADLRSVLTLLLRFEHVYNEALRMRLDEAEGIATLRLWFEFGEPAPAEQALALGVAALHGIIRECVGSRWRPLAVCFHNRAPADLETLHRVFGPGLQFEHDFTGIVFYASDLDAPNSLSDPLLRPYAQRFLDSVVSPRATSTSDRVRELIEFLLPLGKCSMDEVARGLGMDRRTLHRHLAAEGEAFSSILHSTRAGLAERYLANQRNSITEVANLLGFAAPSGFSRWFHQQFGISPRDWRDTSGRAADQLDGMRKPASRRGS